MPDTDLAEVKRLLELLTTQRERPIDRRLAETEEGRIQRYALYLAVFGGAMATVLTYIGADPSPAYALMGSAGAAAIGNAVLGGARQLAKGKAEG